MAEVHPGAELARAFQIGHEEQMTRETRPRAASDILRDRLFIEAWIRVYKQGIVKATVINTHLFPLEVNLGYVGYMTVPARKPGEPFAKFIIDKPKMDARDLGDARFMPEPISPYELAQEFVREYKETGGVFAYPGTDEPEPEDLAAALEGQTAYYWREFNIAQDLWSHRRQNHLISNRQRDAARALVERGLVEKPEWLDRRVDKADRQEKECDACGTTLRAKAAWCTFCNYIFDPEFILANKGRVPTEIYNIAKAGLEVEAEEAVVSGVQPPEQIKNLGSEPKGIFNIPKAEE